MRLNLLLWVSGLTLAACLVGVWSQANRSRKPVAEAEAIAPLRQGSLYAEIRSNERRRAPRRPTEENASKHYESLRSGRYADRWTMTDKHVGRLTFDASRLASTKRVPETKCRSVEVMPVANEGPFEMARGMHNRSVLTFWQMSGFGAMRMVIFRSNERGIFTGSPAVDRVELVGLLLHDEPCVYVMDEMATPAKVRIAQRRPLDEFEERGLDAVRNGAELVWTREAPARMFGALRADSDCLACHPGAKKGELLGAFTYYLDTPVDQLDPERRKPRPK